MLVHLHIHTTETLIHLLRHDIRSTYIESLLQSTNIAHILFLRMILYGLFSTLFRFCRLIFYNLLSYACLNRAHRLFTYSSMVHIYVVFLYSYASSVYVIIRSLVHSFVVLIERIFKPAT